MGTLMRHAVCFLNVVAFCTVIAFLNGEWSSSVGFLGLASVAAALNVTLATLAVYRFAAARPEWTRPTNVAALLIGICYVAMFLLGEWYRVN